MNFLEHGLEPFFEFAAKFRAGDQRPHIQGDHSFLLQTFRDISLDNPDGQPFDNGSFAHAGLADQDRIVLGTSRKNLNHPANFIVASDDRIELSLARRTRQITAILFERLIGAFGILRGHPLIAAHLLQAG